MQVCTFRSIPGLQGGEAGSLRAQGARAALREMRFNFRQDGVPSGMMGGHLRQLLERAYGPGVSIDDWLDGRTERAPRTLGDEVETPELETLLRSRGDVNPLILEDLELIAEALAARHASLQLVADHCQIDASGRFFLSVFARTVMLSGVRVGDQILGGIDVMGDGPGGRMVVRSRLVRQACVNGAVIPAHRGMGSVLYIRESDGSRQGSAEDVVRRSFAPRLLERAVVSLRAAALTPVRDPITALAGYGLYLRPNQVARIKKVFDRDQDASLYGAFNALTETARDEVESAERRRLEREAGSLIVAFLRLAPASYPRQVGAPLAAEPTSSAGTDRRRAGAFDPPTAPV